MIPRKADNGGVPPRRSTLIVTTLAIWAVAWIVWTADVLVEPVPFAVERAARRLPLCLAGAALCFGFAWVIENIPRARRGLLVATIGVGLVFCSLVFAGLNEIVFYVLAPRWGGPALVHIPDVAMLDGWVFMAWTLLYGALAADASRRDRELRLATSQAAALDAQHRLLMSQAQPHFLFNALNAIYALVLDADSAGAREAILKLSAYLRRSLAAPDGDTTLGEELDAARDYLAIEQLRFGDRIKLVDLVPESLRPFATPSLILQPVVENSVKHGLGDDRRGLTITLRAERSDGQVRIIVEDDGAGRAFNDGGIGLASLAQRLKARFGPVARLDARPGPDRGFMTILVMPDRR